MEHGSDTEVPSLIVLVVEDELLVAMDLEAVLIEAGHQVLGPAASVDEALRLLETKRPDVALLDYNLQGETVVPVAESLSDLDVPFVLASAYDAQTLSKWQVFASAIKIGKPMQNAEMLRCLQDAVGAP